MKPPADSLAASQLLSKGIPALIRLNDGIDLLYAVQVRSPLSFPVGRTRNAQGRYLVKPERVAIALSLHQDHEASSTCLVEESKPVGKRSVAASPPELLCAIERDAEADSGLLAFLVRIGDADGGLLDVGHISQTQFSQEA